MKPESRALTFPIVGIRHYLPNGEADFPELFSRLPIGATVYLRIQPAGDDFPGSISVWDDECNQIGSVSKTYRRYIELDVPKDGMLPVKVSGHSAEEKCMYFEAVNKNGYAEPYITREKCEEGEIPFPLAEEDKRLQTLTAFMLTILEELKDKDKGAVPEHFLSTANKYAQICCLSLDGNSSFCRKDIKSEMEQLEDKFPQLVPFRNKIHYYDKDLGRKDVRTKVYRSQYERIKQTAMKKDNDGLSPLDRYIEKLKFKNGDQLTSEIISNEIVHLSDLLSKELGGKYSECISCDEKFATSLYSLNYDWEAICLLFTRQIKLDYLKEIKNSLNVGSKNMFVDTEYYTTKHSQRVQNQGESVRESYAIAETGLPLPRSINTKRAQTYFQKAIDNGLLRLENGRFSWNQIGKRGAKAQLAYFCGKVYGYEPSTNGNAGTSFPEEDLNELFGETRMQASLQQLHAAKKEQSWRPRIDELFE